MDKLELEFMDKAAISVLNAMYQNQELLNSIETVSEKAGISAAEGIAKACYEQAAFMYKERRKRINKYFNIKQ